MTGSVDRLWEFCCDINKNEVNDHIIVNGSGGIATVGIDTEWLDGWHRAVGKLIDDIRRDYIELPVDADGVPIRIGDSVEVIGYEDGTIAALTLCERGGWEASVRPTGWDTPTVYDVESVRHHCTPTVEDVLREFALSVCKDEALTIRKGVVEEYVAKLREVMRDE